MFAAATGRTLVLPPKMHLYLLHGAATDFETYFDLSGLKDRQLIKTASVFDYVKSPGVVPPPDPKLRAALQSEQAWQSLAVGKAHLSHKLWTWLRRTSTQVRAREQSRRHPSRYLLRFRGLGFGLYNIQTGS